MITMSTAQSQSEKPRREQLLAEQLMNEQDRLKNLDKEEQKELEASRFLNSFTHGKYEHHNEGMCMYSKNDSMYLQHMLILH